MRQLMDDTQQIGEDLHARALAFIAAENARAGKSIDDYTAEEYSEALGRAYEELNGYDDHLRAALAQINGGDETVVSAAALRERQQEILAKQGFPRSASGRILAPDSDSIMAMRQAVDELGRPGEPRKDLADRPDRGEMLARAAVDAGRLTDTVTARQSFARFYEIDPLAAERAFAAQGVAIDENGDPREVSLVEKYGRDALKLAAVRDDVLELPDEESLQLHLRAEALIEKKGWGKRNPQTNELEYDAAKYVKACDEIVAHDRWQAEQADAGVAA